jgi:acylphosphatase
VLACGVSESLDRLETWLHSGPPYAKVAGVEATAVEMAKPPSFTIA